jgi:hypothetical protein
LAMPAVSAATYVGSIRLKGPGPWDLKQNWDRGRVRYG